MAEARTMGKFRIIEITWPWHYIATSDSLEVYLLAIAIISPVLYCSCQQAAIASTFDVFIIP